MVRGRNSSAGAVHPEPRETGRREAARRRAEPAPEDEEDPREGGQAVVPAVQGQGVGGLRHGERRRGAARGAQAMFGLAFKLRVVEEKPQLELQHPYLQLAGLEITVKHNSMAGLLNTVLKMANGFLCMKMEQVIARMIIVGGAARR